MTTKTATTLILTAALTTATAAAAKVDAGFHNETDLDGYQTYTWNVDANAADREIDTVIRTEIEARLAAAGLERVEEGGDLSVDIATSATQETRVEITEIDPHFVHPRRPRRNRLAWRIDPWHGYPWLDLAHVDVTDVHEGHLEVQMIDADSHETVWEGAADGRVRKSTKKNAKKAVKALDKMFRDFPTRPTVAD